MASQPGRKIPVIEGRRDKQKSFLPTPKSFAPVSKELPTQEYRKPFSQPDTVQPKLQTGDKVCIGGIKFGVLRYFGKTHIAPGLWCGISLDDCEGKHDGEVEGVRYFTCIPGHGIFAPVEKVTRIEHRSHHDLHNDVIEEEVDIPQDSPTDQASHLPSHVLPRPHRRLLPQPKVFNRQGSKEKVTIPSKIDEQNEDADETGATQKFSDLSSSPSKSKLSAVSRLSSGKYFSDLDGDQVCTTLVAANEDDERKTAKFDSAFSSPLSRTFVLNEKGDGSNGESQVSELLKNQPKTATNVRALPVLTKPSRLPGSSKLPQFSRGDGHRKSEPSTQNINYTESFRKTNDEAPAVTDLNKTYVLNDPTLLVPDNKLLIESASSGDDSLTGDIQECLESDRRHFLNLTFDTEGGSSPPEHNLQQEQTVDHSQGKRIKPGNVSKLEGNKTFNVSANSSLGILDICDSEVNSDLLQDLTPNISKETKTSLNLTDSEKLLQVTVLPKRQDRVASLGDTFEVDGAITSTPLITEGKLKSRLPSHSSEFVTFADLARSSKKFAISDSKDGNIVDSNAAIANGCDLNSTYNIDDNKAVGIVGEDTLDWRQEASDGEAESASSDEGNEINKETRDLGIKTEIVIIDTDLENTVQNELNDKVSSLTDHMNKLQINKKQENSSTNLNISKFKKPMTDSGISEQGDLFVLEHGRMADSCEMKSGDDFGNHMADSTDLSQYNVHNLSAQELQLHADLVAGHTKKERPLSLISSISADTGYVPDTDSERGTLTVNSPLDWTEKMASSEMSISETELTDLDKAYTESFKHFRSAVMKGTDRIQEEHDSDIYSDTGTITAEQDTLKGGSDIEDISGLVMDVKGISAEDVLPLDLQVVDDVKTNQITTPTNKDGVPLTSDTVEDERIEADQQLDISSTDLNTAVSIEEMKEASPEVNENIDEKEEEEVNLVSTSETAQIVSENDDESVDGDKMKLAKVAKGKGKTPAKKKKEVEKIEYKKPNINVGSRLADYIKSPLPTKPKEEKENTEAAKNKRNLGLKKKVGKVEEAKSKFEKEEKVEKKKEKIEKEPPKIIKRTPPKSKWDNIMSQIEAGHSTTKPKTEVKSRLEAYLNAPPPPQLKKDIEVKKEKPKKKLPAVPTPDYSRVKSKLNLGSAPPVIRREMSPAPSKRDQSPRSRVVDAAHKRHSSVGSNASSNVVLLDLNDSVGSSALESAVNSVRSSHSDLNTIEGGDSSVPTTPRSVSSKPTNRALEKITTTTKRERRDSNSSTMSDVSQGSVKVMNKRNSRLTESNNLRRKSAPIKSSIPPAVNSTIRKVSQPSRSLDSSPAKGTNNITNKRGDGSKSAPPPSNRDAVKNKRNDALKNVTPKKTNNQNRNKTKTKNNQKANQQVDVISGPSQQTKQEITRLEALCESRTKELNFARIQMKNNIQAFDAMAILVNHLTNNLNAFSCPSLEAKVKTQGELNEELQKQLFDLQTHKSQLEQEIEDINKKNEEILSQMKTEHSDYIATKEAEWTKISTENQHSAEENHKKEVTEMKSLHEKQVSELKSDNSQVIVKLKTSHEDEILALQCKQDLQMEELHKQHRDRLEDITHRFEDIKVGLSEKVEALRCECGDLRDRAKASEEALLRDSDYKVQIALAPYRNLPQEIESLKLVIEMRNEEIQKLKKKNTDLEQQAEELMAAKEKIISQQQKIENMEAIISMKTDHEKQLHDKCQMLMRKYDKESKANKRLSMDFEELVWKVNQGDPGSVENLTKLGGSPCNSEASSPLVRRKNRSPAFSEVEKSPLKVPVYRRSISSNESAADKKLKRRSATFLADKDRTSPTGSPLHKKHTYSDSSSPTRSLHHHLETPAQAERMVQSCSDMNPSSSGRDSRLIQSCSDADVFETPQGLPNPPTPDDLKHFCVSGDSKADTTLIPQGEISEVGDEKTSEHKKSVSPDDVNVEVSLTLDVQNGCDFEEFDGEDLQIDTQVSETKDDASDLSHSTTESCCPSDITSGTGSMIWDYEKMDSLKSMDSSQTSQNSDTLQDSNPNFGEGSKVDNNTLTNIKDFTTEEC